LDPQLFSSNHGNTGSTSTSTSTSNSWHSQASAQSLLSLQVRWWHHHHRQHASKLVLQSCATKFVAGRQVGTSARLLGRQDPAH
jgi:hypothetical protein